MASPSKRLRIGFVPEHFSTPLSFATQFYNLDADLIPYPTGTGALAASLKASDGDKQIDIAIGLTEGFIADLSKTDAAGQDTVYGLAGTYVETPLRWAISTGANRDEITSISDLKDTRVGVSRIGSGSYVMSFVFADQQGWLESSKEPFKVIPIGDFAALRKGVRLETKGHQAEFFMWEHFTTKHFWDNGELKRIGHIDTPWPSWMIAARKSVTEEQLKDLTTKLDQGVKRYLDDRNGAIEHITSTMHYSKEDTEEWMKTVKFVNGTYGVDPAIVDKTLTVLRKAGALGPNDGDSSKIITASRT